MIYSVGLVFISSLGISGLGVHLLSDHRELTLRGDHSLNLAVGPCRERIPAGTERRPVSLSSLSTPACPSPFPTVTELPPGDEGAQLGDVTKNAQGPVQGPGKRRNKMSLRARNRMVRFIMCFRSRLVLRGLRTLRKCLRKLPLVECASQLLPPHCPPGSLLCLGGFCSQEAARRGAGNIAL